MKLATRDPSVDVHDIVSVRLGQRVTSLFEIHILYRYCLWQR